MWLGFLFFLAIPSLCKTVVSSCYPNGCLLSLCLLLWIPSSRVFWGFLQGLSNSQCAISAPCLGEGSGWLGPLWPALQKVPLLRWPPLVVNFFPCRSTSPLTPLRSTDHRKSSHWLRLKCGFT